MDETKDKPTEYILLFAILAAAGWLIYKHTGTGTNQISPHFWAGIIITLIAQIIRKTFDLKGPKTSKEGKKL